VAEAQEPSAVRLAGTLAVAGLVSGLVLAGVMIVTAPAIEKNRAEALRAAIYTVVPGTQSIRTHALRDGRLVALEDASAPKGKEARIYEGLDADGRSIGFAIPGSGAGFQDTIELLYGFDPARSVIIGMAVLESRETPGLGDKIAFDPAFLKNFEALSVEPEIELVKKGARSAPNQVDAITGATISCRAIVNILNTSTGRWQPVLKQATPAGSTAQAAPAKDSR
jgi:Na+-translocating ferredoxin:NAD+ oxidoreductase subunit G